METSDIRFRPHTLLGTSPREGKLLGKHGHLGVMYNATIRSVLCDFVFGPSSRQLSDVSEALFESGVNIGCVMMRCVVVCRT